MLGNNNSFKNLFFFFFDYLISTLLWINTCLAKSHQIFMLWRRFYLSEWKNTMLK